MFTLPFVVAVLVTVGLTAYLLVSLVLRPTRGLTWEEYWHRQLALWILAAVLWALVVGFYVLFARAL